MLLYIKYTRSMVVILNTHCGRFPNLISERPCWSTPSGFKAKQLQTIDKEAGITIVIRLMCPKKGCGKNMLCVAQSLSVRPRCSSLWLTQFQNSGRAEKSCAAPEVCAGEEQGRAEEVGFGGGSVCSVMDSSSCVCGKL